MKCVREDLKAHITDVLVGEAETPAREQVLSHLETCASCREDRDRMVLGLGLLKEAPPWAEATAEADTLSAIQWQKIESLAGRGAGAPKAAKPASAPMSWLASQYPHKARQAFAAASTSPASSATSTRMLSL